MTSKYDDVSRDINYDAIRFLVTNMQPNHVLYKIIQTELKKRGNWKDKPRGISFKKGDDPRRHKLQP